MIEGRMVILQNVDKNVENPADPRPIFSGKLLFFGKKILFKLKSFVLIAQEQSRHSIFERRRSTFESILVSAYI